jgi:hypothetical protein
MAKFEAPFEDVEQLFNEKIQLRNLDQFINIAIVVNNKSKDIFKVVKANDLFKHRTGDDIIIILNQNIFDKLEDLHKHIVVEDALACIHYDTEKDKLIMTKPDVIAYSGVLSKFTFDTWNVVRESIKSLYVTDKGEDAVTNETE